ncbi:pyridoxamine kinase [Helicovermis profundi]
MSNPVKKIMAIHDLSGFGRASLTAIVPILSTMGIQVCPVPTAILSTHTGGFDEFTLVDLTDSMEKYILHWSKLKLEFDVIYSGFLASTKQIEIVSKAIDLFKNEDNFVVVDPVMGDEGNLYKTMDKSMINAMKNLIKKADIITPNFTEATYLLNEDYREKISDKEIKEWLTKLSDMGPEIVIITSVPDNLVENQTNVIAYNRLNDVFWKVGCKYIPAFYPGTGDAFTSVVVGALLQGDNLPIALERGVQFISNGIKASYGFDYPKREGILIERVLDTLKLPVISSSYEMLE